jgi:hypothetical protein
MPYPVGLCRSPVKHCQYMVKSWSRSVEPVWEPGPGSSSAIGNQEGSNPEDRSADAPGDYQPADAPEEHAAEQQDSGQFGGQERERRHPQHLGNGVAVARTGHAEEPAERSDRCA